MQPQIPGQVTMRITCGGILGDLTRYIQADGQQVIVGAVAGSSRVFATDADCPQLGDRPDSLETEAEHQPRGVTRACAGTQAMGHAR